MSWPHKEATCEPITTPTAPRGERADAEREAEEGEGAQEEAGEGTAVSRRHAVGEWFKENFLWEVCKGQSSAMEIVKQTGISVNHMLMFSVWL